MILQRALSTFFGKSVLGPNGPSLDTLLAQLDAHADSLTAVVRPAAESKPRTPFDSKVPAGETWVAKLKPHQAARALPVMLPLLLNMRRSARFYDEQYQPTQGHASPEFIAELEAIARAAGAKDIRYVRVPRYAIFRDKAIPHDYAIIFTVEMDKAAMETAPSFDCMLEVMRGYRNLAIISNKLAGHLRGHGFAAYPGTALGGLTDYTHLGELAGLGAVGYHGLLITPTEGARLRVNTIYTNIENLPIQTENKHLWVRDFCAMCRKCIRSCPVTAIFPQPRPRSDGGMQSIDPDSCRDYFASNFGCAVCLAVCPFSQTGYETIRERFKGNPGAPQFHIGQIELLPAAPEGAA